MSKPVNDVRASSTDERYVGVVFSGTLDEAVAQAKAAPDYGLPDADIRAPKGMGRDRAALLGFLRLHGDSPLKQNPGVPFAVLSAELAGEPSAFNAQATAELQDDLERHGLRFVSILGSYKGAEENSFVALLSSVLDWHVVQALGRIYDQESVLLVNADRSAALHYADGRVEGIGQWTAVDSVAGLDSWTRDALGQHYSVVSKHSKYSVEYAQEKGWLPS